MPAIEDTLFLQILLKRWICRHVIDAQAAIAFSCNLLEELSCCLFNAATFESLVLIVVFKDAPHYLSKVIAGEDDCPASSISVLGKPLVLYNISKLAL